MRTGALTSEFLAAGGVSAGLLYLAFQDGAPTAVRCCAALGAAVASLGYGASRARVKSSRPVAPPSGPA